MAIYAEEAEAVAAATDSGDTSWILTATALVLFMTMPGLALFYGGLVRSKNVLSVMAQCSGIAFMASISLGRLPLQPLLQGRRRRLDRQPRCGFLKRSHHRNHRQELYPKRSLSCSR